MITITDDEKKGLFQKALERLVAYLISNFSDDLQLLTPSQVCGLLNINQKTLDTLKDGPPRVTLVAGAVIRYRASAVAAYIKRREDFS